MKKNKGVPKEAREWLKKIGSKGGRNAAKNPRYSEIRRDAALLRWKRYRAGLDKGGIKTPAI